jgi:tetratricopeptide (TPR) repeat protein
MLPGQNVLKVLVVGDSDDVKGWLNQFVARDKLLWRVRYTCNLRVNSPDNQLGLQDVIIVLWDRQPLVTFQDVLSRKSIDYRSVEGVIRELASEDPEGPGAAALLRRTVVIGRGLTREDAIFLAEHQVGSVFSLPEKRIAWDRQVANVVRRIEALHLTELARRDSAEERIVSRFLEMLSVWERVSDELQMKATDQLLRVLGDSSRYAELLARKCIVERNFRGAEQWLGKAISKNPNYFSAMQLLADVFFEMGKPEKSLALLEKLRDNNPRNVQRLVKIAKCYVKMGEHAKADKVLCDALCIDEFYPEAREELGRVRVVLGDYPAARILLQHTSKSRDLANFLNKLGIDLVAKSKFQDSIEHYKNAQFVLPGNEQSHLLFFNIGLAYAKWGKLAEARNYVKLALIRQPGYAKASELLDKIEGRQSA